MKNNYMKTKPTQKIVTTLLELLSHGLTKGLGKQAPGKMCVEAAVCAAYELPHGDDPPCVAPAVRAFKIALNDLNWSSNMARADGMRELAIAQLGSSEIDESIFVKELALATIKKIVPIALHASKLEIEAIACESSTNLKDAESAARSAESAAWNAVSAARSAAWNAVSAERSAAESAAWNAVSAARSAVSAARSAVSAAWNAVRSAERSAAWSAESAAWSAESAAWNAVSAERSAAESAAYDDILILMAEIGVEALRKAKSPGIKFLYLIK